MRGRQMRLTQVPRVVRKPYWMWPPQFTFSLICFFMGDLSLFANMLAEVSYKEQFSHL